MQHGLCPRAPHTGSQPCTQHRTSGALHSPKAAPCSRRDGDPQEQASRCSRDTKGTQRGHHGEQPRLRSAGLPARGRRHIPAPAQPRGASGSPGAGGRSRGAPGPGSSSPGHGTGPGRQPRCAERRMPGALPARPGSSPVLPHYFYPAVAIETPDPLAMMQPLSEALDHQLLLPPTAHGAGGRYFCASAEPPPAGGNEPLGTAQLGSRGGDGWRGHFRAHPLPPSCCSPSRGPLRGQQWPPSALPSAASLLLRIPEQQQALASPGLGGEKARASPCACSRRISPASCPLGRWTCQSSSCGGSLPLGRRGSELGCLEARKGDGTVCPAQDIPGGLGPRSSQSWRRKAPEQDLSLLALCPAVQHAQRSDSEISRQHFLKPGGGCWCT